MRNLVAVFIPFMYTLVGATQKTGIDVLNSSEKTSFNYSYFHNTSSNTTDEDSGSEPSFGLSVLIGFVSIFTVAGNIMVILAVVVFRKLRKIPNLLIVSLASADLIMGGIVLPVGCHYVVGSKWLLGTFACDLWTSIDVLSVTASICTLCAISLDRFVAIVTPFEYSTRMTKHRARLIIVFIWVMSAAIAFIPINLGWWKTDKDYDMECYENPECCEFRINKTYAVVSSLISFYIPLVVMMFAYTIVFKIAIQKRQKICNREGVYRRASMPGTRSLLWGRGEYRAVFTMGIIMGTFVICWLPFFIVNITQVFCDRCIPQTAFTILNWLGYMNSFFNPIIYCHSIEFRRAFKRLLMCSLCREGYQQTSRASLSVSYTPSLSARSSIRSETSLFFGFLRKSSAQRRASKLSVASNSEKSPKLNGFSPPNSATERTFNDNGMMTYKYNNNYSNPRCNLIPRDSMEAQLLSSHSPTYNCNHFNFCSSPLNVVTHRNSNANSHGRPSTYRPIYVNREKRSMSTVAKLGKSELQPLFKTSSHTNIALKVSDTSFLSADTSRCSSKSSISILDQESNGSLDPQNNDSYTKHENGDI